MRLGSPQGSRTHEIALTSPVPNTWVSQAGPRPRHNPSDLRISCTPWSVFQDGAQSNDSSPVTSAQNLDTTTKDLNVACSAAPYTAERIKRRENGTQATQRQATLPPARTPTKGDCTYQQWTNGHPTHLKDYGDHGDGLYVTLGTREQPQGLPPQRRQPDSRVFPTDGPTSTGNAPAAATPPDEPRRSTTTSTP